MRGRIFLWGGLLVGLWTLAAPAGTQDQDQAKARPDPKQVKALMMKKLEACQKVLHGIATNDFGMIEKHAEELLDISKQASFMLVKTPQYDSFSGDFRRSAQTLAKMAQGKNLDGASFTYLEMTLNCFNCHRYVRDLGMIRLEPEVP